MASTCLTLWPLTRQSPVPHCLRPMPLPPLLILPSVALSIHPLPLQMMSELMLVSLLCLREREQGKGVYVCGVFLNTNDSYFLLSSQSLIHLVWEGRYLQTPQPPVLSRPLTVPPLPLLRVTEKLLPFTLLMKKRDFLLPRASPYPLICHWRRWIDAQCCTVVLS